MTPADREDFEERIAIVWDGAPSKAPITWAEAERIATQQRDESQRLPLDDRRGEA